MADVYKYVMTGCAVVGGLTAAAYASASTSAYADGVGTGLEIAPPANILSIIFITCCTIIAGGAWLVRRGHADATTRHIRPAVRAEVDQALADAMPLLVATLSESVARRIEPSLHTVATGAANRTAAVLREAVTADITEIVNGVYRRGQVSGAILQSQATGKPLLTPVRRLSTPEGD